MPISVRGKTLRSLYLVYDLRFIKDRNCISSMGMSYTSDHVRLRPLHLNDYWLSFLESLLLNPPYHALQNREIFSRFLRCIRTKPSTVVLLYLIPSSDIITTHRSPFSHESRALDTLSFNTDRNDHFNQE